MWIPRAARLVILAAAMLVGCGPELTAQPAQPPTPTPAPTRPPYDPAALITVERRDLEDALTGRATVMPKLTDELFFQRDGRIGQVDVATGDQVERGEVLARLEQADLEYQIGLADIDVELAELREREARDNDAAAVELLIAEKEVERARLALERLETEQQSLLITAPYAGRISELTAKVGAEITAFSPVATIVGTEELMVVAEFSGPKSGRVDVGQQLALAPFFEEDAGFMGMITGKIGETGNHMVVEPAPVAPELELGDSLRAVAVLGRADDVLTIPMQAVKTIGQRHYVLLVEGGELRRVFVELGIETDGVVEITAGLEEGQQISER